MPPQEPFNRGYSHPRLWEQYADNDEGICLVLERAALVEAVTRAASSHGRLEHGPVTYRDGPIAPQASGVDLNAQREVVTWLGQRGYAVSFK